MSAEIAIEDAVMAVALDELALTDDELELVDLGQIQREALTSIRLDIKRAAGRSMRVEDYLLAKPTRPPNVIDLMGWLEASRKRAISGPA